MAKGEPRTEAEALDLIKPLLPLLQRGMSEKQACDYAKVPESTLNHYKKKYPKVWSEIKTAKMHLIALASNTVFENVSDPKIAIEVLKRRSKDTWGDSLELGGDNIPVALVKFVGDDDQADNNTDSV